MLVGLVTGADEARAADAEELVTELDQAVAASVDRLLVDLTSVHDMTTHDMNALLDARQQLLARGGTVALVLSPKLRRTFEVVGLDRRFALADDGEDAARLLGLASPVSRARAASARAA